MLRPLLTVSALELRTRLRDGTALVIAVLVPVALATLFGLALGGDDPPLRATVGVVDLDRGRFPAEVRREIAAAEQFEGALTLRDLPSEQAARQAVDGGGIGAAIVFPPGFSRTVERGGRGAITVLTTPESPLAGVVTRSLADWIAVMVESGALTERTTSLANQTTHPNPTHPNPTHPNPTHPNPTHPNSTHPNPANPNPDPDPANPNPTHPNSTHPNPANPNPNPDPDPANPNPANSDSANSDSANSDSANSDSANSDSANSDSANPDSASPDSGSARSADSPQTASPAGRTESMSPAALTVVADPLSGGKVDLAVYHGSGMAALFAFFVVGASFRSLLTERKLGTLNRMRAGPLAPWVPVAGKAIVGFALALFCVCVTWASSALIFGTTWGDPVAVFAVLCAHVLAAAAIMMLVASRVRTDAQADGVIMVVSFVAAFFGGSLVPIPNLPEPLQFVALFTPNGWTSFALIDLAGSGGGLAEVLLPIGVLCAIALTAGGLAAAGLKKGLLG
ncbi:ABC transporter permease [Nonomuraea typhae]|uniref:ABC transporter permease n=1 Tax=Nonomuraea typhae TaxID=2603600 RepID=A0ABW7YVC8_9ACTN